MSIKSKIKAILRSDSHPELERGETYSFEEKGSQLFCSDMPIWLANTDWTARAEISIVNQAHENNIITGIFRVDYIYQGSEQQALSNIFERMYARLSDQKIYLLSSQAEYQQALNEGVLIRDSLQTEGFIHATPRSQLNRLANKYYKDKEQPLILSVDKELVRAELKWEPATGGLYPHIYGPLNSNAITKIEEIALGEDGNFHL